MECQPVDKNANISSIERLTWGAFFLATAAVALYVSINFDVLSSRYGDPLVVAVPVALGLIAARGGRNLSERMTRDRK